MKTWRSVLAGLLLPVSVLAQTPPAPTWTKDQLEAIKTKNTAIIELNGLIAQTNAAVQAKDWPKAKDLAEKLIAVNSRLGAAYPDDPSYAAAEPGYYRLLGTAYLN